MFPLSLKVKSLIDIQDEEEEKHMPVVASLEPWKHYKFRVKIMHRLDNRKLWKQLLYKRYIIENKLLGQNEKALSNNLLQIIPSSYLTHENFQHMIEQAWDKIDKRCWYALWMTRHLLRTVQGHCVAWAGLDHMCAWAPAPVTTTIKPSAYYNTYKQCFLQYYILFTYRGIRHW